MSSPENDSPVQTCRPSDNHNPPTSTPEVTSPHRLSPRRGRARLGRTSPPHLPPLSVTPRRVRVAMTRSTRWPQGATRASPMRPERRASVVVVEGRRGARRPPPEPPASRRPRVRPQPCRPRPPRPTSKAKGRPPTGLRARKLPNRRRRSTSARNAPGQPLPARAPGVRGRGRRLREDHRDQQTTPCSSTSRARPGGSSTAAR